MQACEIELDVQTPTIPASERSVATQLRSVLPPAHPPFFDLPQLLTVSALTHPQPQEIRNYSTNLSGLRMAQSGYTESAAALSAIPVGAEGKDGWALLLLKRLNGGGGHSPVVHSGRCVNSAVLLVAAATPRINDRLHVHEISFVVF